MAAQMAGAGNVTAGALAEVQQGATGVGAAFTSMGSAGEAAIGLGISSTPSLSKRGAARCSGNAKLVREIVSANTSQATEARKWRKVA